MEYCRQCEKNVETDFYPAPEHSPHYGKSVCKECHAFIGWVKKPENKGKRGKSSKFTPDKLEIGYCEICGRLLVQLGSKEVLEIHHLRPVDEGGKDSRGNVLVACSACHRMIHWLRLYLNKHLNDIA